MSFDSARKGVAACILFLAAPGIPLLVASPEPAEPGSSPSPSHEAALFDALDLTRPELSAVAAAWERKDLASAEKEFAAALRARTSIRWGKSTDGTPPAALSPERKKRADDAAEGRLQGGLVPLVYAFPNGEIDWRFNATEHVPGATPNNEWQWQLNRMAFWGDLAAAYRTTGDEKYARAFVRQMRSWIAQCPVPDHVDNVTGSPWRTIEAGLRMAWMWPEPFFAFLRSPSLSDADLAALAGAYLDHGRYLRACHTRLNFLTMEMCGLYSVGTLFPEFKEAADWRSYAAARLAEETGRQFLPDGAQAELSTGYQGVSLGNIVRIVDLARQNGREAELPPGYLDPIEKAYQWQEAILAPDRFLPKLNDSWPVPYSEIFINAVSYFPQRADFRWFRTNGKQGAPPSWNSAFLDRSGLAAMRSGWEPDANYLLFRMGPLGMGHQHQDGLGVILWAYGRELLFNGGGGSYEKSKWRDWAVSTAAHNCVLVDGLTQSRAGKESDPFHDPNLVSQGPLDAHWQSTPAFDFASGRYDQGYGPGHVRPAVQQRDVLFLKPDLYIVADRLTPADALSHRYQARWQLLTTQTRIDPATRLLATTDRGAANLAIVPLLAEGLAVSSASGQQEPELLGWNIRKDMDPQNVPATTLLHTRAGTGPQLLLTLLLPLRPGEENPVARVDAQPADRAATVTLADGRRLAVSCPPSLGIVVQETLPDGSPGRSAQGGVP